MPYPTNTPTENSLPTFGNNTLPEPPGGYPPTEPDALPEGQFPGVNSNSVSNSNRSSDVVSWGAKGSENNNPIYTFTNLVADCGAGIDQYFASPLNPLDELSFPLNPEVPSVCQWIDLTIYDDVSEIADNGFQDQELKGAFNFLGEGITIGEESFASFGSLTAYFGSNIISNCTLKDSSFRSSEIKGPITFYSPDISLAKNCFYNAFYGGGELLGLYDFGNRVPLGFAGNSSIKNLTIEQAPDGPSCIIEEDAFSNCPDLVSASIINSKAAVFGERSFKGLLSPLSIVFPAEAVSFHKESFAEAFINGSIEFSNTLVSNNISFAGDNNFSQNERVFYNNSFSKNTLSQTVIDLSLTNGNQFIGRNAFSKISADYSTLNLQNANNAYKVSIGPRAFKDSFFDKINFAGNQLLVEYGAFDCQLQSKSNHINLNFNNYEIWDEAFRNAQGRGGLTRINIENADETSLLGHHTFKIQEVGAKRPFWNTKRNGELHCWNLSVRPDPDNGEIGTGLTNLVARPLRGDTKLQTSSISSNGFSLSPPEPYIDEEPQEIESYTDLLNAYSVTDMEYIEQVVQDTHPESVNVYFYADLLPKRIQVTLDNDEVFDFDRVIEPLPMGGSYEKLEFVYENEVVIGGVEYIEFANLTFYDATDPFWDSSVEVVSPVTGQVEVVDDAFGGLDPSIKPGGWVLAYSLVEESDNNFGSPVSVVGYTWTRNGDPGSINDIGGLSFAAWDSIVIQNFSESTRVFSTGPNNLAGYYQSVTWQQNSGDQTVVTMSHLPVIDDFPSPEEAYAWYQEFKKVHLICGTVNGF